MEPQHSHANGGGGASCSACGPSLEGHEQQQQQQDLEEQQALERILNAYKLYSRSAEFDIQRWQRMLARLPSHHQHLLAHHAAKFARARQCIQCNHFFIMSMLAAFDLDPDNQLQPPPPHLAAPKAAAAADAAAEALLRPEVQPTASDVEKVRYVLKNLARDWSAECAEERAQSFGRITTELQRLFGDRLSMPQPSVPRVLIPGAGLGRLCCEVAGLGCETQGNEFSYFMLVAASFMMNYTREEGQYTIFPWATTTCNNFDDEDQLHAVGLPDTLPGAIVARAPAAAVRAVEARGSGLLSMAAGDFEEVYSRPDQAGAWDCVATCFFMDTAHNIIRYLEVIHYALRPGGAWVNLGPLLYHWADGHGDSADELSLELSLADVRRIALGMGFRLDREERAATAYTANPKSMYQTVYTSSFWTMIKQ